MRPVTETELFGYLVGVLEPGRAEEVEAALAESPQLRAKLGEVGATVRMTAPMDRGWQIPPPGIAGGRVGFGVGATPAVVMAGRAQAGDRVQLWIEPVTNEAMVVLLAEKANGWRVMFPNDVEEVITLEELPTREDGARRIDVVLTEVEGPQRWAVALPSASTSVDWAASETSRWDELRRGIASGEVAVTAVDVAVEARSDKDAASD